MKSSSENYNDFTSPISVNFQDDDEIFGLTKQEEKLIEELIKCTAELKEHYEDALKMATAKASDEALLEELVKCLSCKENFLRCNYDNNKCHCFFCTYEEEGEKAANEYLSVIQGLNRYEIVKDGGEYPLYNCPDCGKYSFVNIDGRYTCNIPVCREHHGLFRNAIDKDEINIFPGSSYLYFYMRKIGVMHFAFVKQRQLTLCS